MPKKPTCFVIAPIGPKESETRKRSDKVLKHVLKKALSHEYEVTHGDNVNEPGMITSQVLRAVQDSQLVVSPPCGERPQEFNDLDWQGTVLRISIRLRL